ncbi:MAG: hypothetical protein KKC68_06535 [Candidatus Thermoplasmatota archaeon]|nr:hypothetical protein [Candidatus Thermoplasmatota archaeon]MBU1941416.1 hypothetical protein [Candidatus Thermoplasmatota archaeon]
MKEKIMYGSVLTAALLLLASVSTVIGSHSESAETATSFSASPVFTVRAQRMVQTQTPQPITTTFIGKGLPLPVMGLHPTRVDQTINRALKMLQAKPQLLDTLLTQLADNTNYQQLVTSQGLTITQVENQLRELLQNPEELVTYLHKIVQTPSDLNTPQPLGLSTSNPIGCFIIVIAMIPVFLILALLICTITIVTCLNIGGCFEAFWENLVGNFLQGLSPGF